MTKYRLLWIAFAILCAAGLFVAFHWWIANWFWHPLGACTGPNCKGYQLWSGIASDIGEVTLITGLILGYRKINCHAKTCPRIGHYEVEGTPYKVCKYHHPKVPNSGPSAEYISDIHHIKMAYARGHIHVAEMEKRLAEALRREDRDGSIQTQG